MRREVEAPMSSLSGGMAVPCFEVQGIVPWGSRYCKEQLVDDEAGRETRRAGAGRGGCNVLCAWVATTQAWVAAHQFEERLRRWAQD